MRCSRRLPVLALMALAAACDSPASSAPGAPARMDVLSGDLQANAVAGQELPAPLVVRVLDEDGDPVPGQLVNFVVTAGEGAVFGGAAQTNAQGEARERWTLGTVAGDTQRVEVRAVDATTGQARVFATFRAVAGPGPAARLQALPLQQGTGAAGQALADSLVVRVSDAYGNPVAGATVTWAVTSGGGSLSSPTALSRADGTAKVTWTLGGAAGPQTARASLGGQAPVDFTANAVAGGAVTVEFVTPPLHFTARNQEIALAVTGRDAFGNPVAGAAVTLVSLDASVVELATGPTRAVSRNNGSTRIVASLANGAADTLDAVVQQVPAGLRILPDSAFVLAGETVALTAAGWDANGASIPNPPVSYASDNAPVASIQGTAVHANAAGTARITGTAGPGVQDQAVVEVFNPFSAQRVAAGSQSTCAIGTDGHPYCWGENSGNRLGTGGGPTVRTPARVAGPDFTAISLPSSAGRNVCALTAAGAAYCWGGDALSGYANAPAPVPGGLAFTRIATGPYSACGVTTGQRVYCWGESRYGRLGTGDTVSSAVPRPVDSSASFTDVTVGANHACAVSTDHTVYCWGANFQGETGAPTLSSCFAREGYDCPSSPKAVPGGHAFVQVVAGYGSTCALTTAGVAYCWGSNSTGQLGVSSSASPARGTLVAVGGGYAFTSLAMGFAHACGITAGGEAYCWGNNVAGQAGRDGREISVAPGRAAAGLTFTSLDLGTFYTCGVASGGGGLYCWGQENDGQMGDGYRQAERSNPVRVRVR